MKKESRILSVSNFVKIEPYSAEQYATPQNESCHFDACTLKFMGVYGSSVWTNNMANGHVIEVKGEN